MQTYTLKEASKVSHLSLDGLTFAAQRGVLKAVKTGKGWIVEEADLMDLYNRVRNGLKLPKKQSGTNPIPEGFRKHIEEVRAKAAKKKKGDQNKGDHTNAA